MRCLIACTCQIFICAFTIWGPCILLSLRIRICWRNSGFFLFNASVANMKSDFLVHKVRADICQACKFSSFFSVRIQKKKCWPPKCTCKFYQCNLFSYILGNLPKKLSIQSIRRPKWHFISSRCLSSAIPERQYQIFVNYHKPSIHCFISFEALITWPI